MGTSVFFFQCIVLQLWESASAEPLRIEAIEASGVQINGVWHRSSVAIHQQRCIPHWADNLTHLTVNDFALFREPLPQVLLLGTGSRFYRLPSTLKKSLERIALPIECMDTIAAFRTYIALQSEGRLVSLGVFFQ